MVYRISLLVLLILLLAACQGVVRKDFDMQGNPTGGGVGDPALKALVKIVQADSEIVDGYMRVRILLQNRTHLRRQIEYKVVFYDEQGFPLEDRWGWRPLGLEPKGEEVIDVKSFSTSAASYQLQLQRASMDDLG